MASIADALHPYFLEDLDVAFAAYKLSLASKTENAAVSARLGM
ncbi:hypothetical protein SJ05684_b56250 (plasmid) [Sinorhizobium sojae CCBAU 05684]|uniref:Uncharacterized protein n=1 Tax=Sinorhizobium sojae CCBAU 05684 TaxID=716928 RepID=A0A249PLI4_9HYPH|nr:hypothetical protein [Sinorhizobium sojae]ASY66607.1 hypothetical protein SJ05684_b56250 [Sinorhizobium sojae CCBAU 05684]